MSLFLAVIGWHNPCCQSLISSNERSGRTVTLLLLKILSFYYFLILFCVCLPSPHSFQLLMIVGSDDSHEFIIFLLLWKVEALRKEGISAVRLDSSMTPDDLRTATAEIVSGRVKVLYITPERFNNEKFRRLLGMNKIFF